MPSPTLPTELIGSVIEHVGDQIFNQGTAPTLAACCLTSKAFLPFARAELYRRVAITMRHKENEAQLLRTLQDAPHLSALVRDLFFPLWLNSDAPAAEQLVTRTAALCCNVQDFAMCTFFATLPRPIDGQVIQQAIVSAAETLKRVELVGNIDWEGGDLAAILTGCHRLTDFSIESLDQFDGDTIVPFSAVCQLESFWTLNTVNPELLEMILGASKDTLRTLFFGGFGADGAFDFEPFTHLREVTVRWAEFGQDEVDLIPLFTSLGTCPALDTLHLNGDDPPFHPVDALPLLRLLPPSLTCLNDRGWLLFDTDTLLKLLRDRRLLPNLGHIHIPSHLRVAEDRWEERAEEDVDAVNRLARSWGVDVCWED